MVGVPFNCFQFNQLIALIRRSEYWTTFKTNQYSRTIYAAVLSPRKVPAFVSITACLPPIFLPRPSMPVCTPLSLSTSASVPPPRPPTPGHQSIKQFRSGANLSVPCSFLTTSRCCIGAFKCWSCRRHYSGQAAALAGVVVRPSRAATTPPFISWLAERRSRVRTDNVINVSDRSPFNLVCRRPSKPRLNRNKRPPCLHASMPPCLHACMPLCLHASMPPCLLTMPTSLTSCPFNSSFRPMPNELATARLPDQFTLPACRVGAKNGYRW